jgi:hypothetical protein
MNKTYRYGLVVVGCIAHATILRMLCERMWASDASQPYLALKQYVSLGLFLTWPAWGVALWYCGWRRVVSMVIPMVIGSVILWPVAEGFLFILAFMGGGKT